MNDDSERWPGLFRGSVLSATIAKHVSYVTSGDSRAQGLILLNSALIPLALNGMAHQELRTAATLCLITALATICLCIFSLYPKRLKGKEEGVNLLHYAEFCRLSERDYLDRMRALCEEPGRLAEAVARDLYHLGTRIVAPKFLLLRFAYIVFLLGQLTAALLATLALR